jgi:AcrR family transcriptional regulator
MPARRRIDPTLVVQTAVEIADRDGLDSVTLAAVAEALGIRIPSLYNHVSGLPGLRYQMSLWAVREVVEQARRAAVGAAGADALLRVAAAYRAFAHEHPGVYRLTLRAPAPDEPELATAGQELIDILLAALRPYGLGREDTLHTIRGLRSVLHGFIDLEVSGGFGLPLDRDESFRRLMTSFIAGITSTSVQPT